jgi:hypothetical protein
MVLHFDSVLCFHNRHSVTDPPLWDLERQWLCHLLPHYLCHLLPRIQYQNALVQVILGRGVGIFVLGRRNTQLRSILRNSAVPSYRNNQGRIF